jgi:uncharacterized membrane protein (TIGR02234 family)
MAERRRTFAPAVLLGLAAAGLGAVAGNRPWVAWSGDGADDLTMARLTGDDSATVPLAGALALVLLACWGVVLVTRGRLRRLVGALGLVVALAMVLTTLLGVRSATAGLRDDLSRLGVGDVSTQVQAWFWVYLGCAVIAVVVAGLAVRWMPSWPEMGARYDAPGSSAQRDRTDLDLWRALDEGRDPTLAERRTSDP